MTPLTDTSQGMRGSVVVYPGQAREAQHERVIHHAIAKRLARLQGLRFSGEYDPRANYTGRLYFIPVETVVGVEKARQLGMQGERDLFGGVVPQPFMATKSITHPLVGSQAHAPQGWSTDFSRRVGDAVLAGFSVFAREDAHQAGVRLLEHGPVRLKAVRANAGRGQSVVTDTRELLRAVEALNKEEVATYGLVLEEHLEDITTYSVGQVRVGERVASYYGLQHLTEDNNGAKVYGGTDLVIVNGGFDALLTLDLSAEIRLAITQAQTYDAAATDCFPGFFASRRNYDVACGRDARGCRRSGVLEQSWRIGGASSAEIVALDALQTAQAPPVIRAASLEIYGTQPELPPHATLLFSGVDADIGPITKCVTVEPYDHA